jgi:protein SCO1
MNVLALALLAALPNIDVVDDSGRVRSTAEWKGVPTIVAPMYARCPLACPMIAQALKKGVARSDAPPVSYRIVLFSFDPHDTPEDLRRFRERQKIPLNWSIVAPTKKGDARLFLDACGYRFGEVRGAFTHPNAIIALTADLEVAQFIIGTNYDIDAALVTARGSTDWIGRYGGWMLALALFACLLSAVYLVTLIGMKTRKQKPETRTV